MAELAELQAFAKHFKQRRVELGKYGYILNSRNRFGWGEVNYKLLSFGLVWVDGRKVKVQCRC